MGQLAVINAPSSFTFIWAAVKPWLSKETAEKVDVLGSDYRSVLLDLVDEESLPSSLGGKCTCEGAGGCNMSGVGPWLDGRIGWGPNSSSKAAINDIETVSPPPNDISTNASEGSTEHTITPASLDLESVVVNTETTEKVNAKAVDV